MKNWSKFYDYSFRKQFIKDLSKMENIDDIKWFFNSTSGINDISELKTMVVNALTKNNNPIKELDVVSLQQVKNILGDKFGVVTKQNKSTKLIEALKSDDFFEEIFEITK